jgi:hypothetical protein
MYGRRPANKLTKSQDRFLLAAPLQLQNDVKTGMGGGSLLAWTGRLDCKQGHIFHVFLAFAIATINTLKYYQLDVCVETCHIYVLTYYKYRIFVCLSKVLAIEYSKIISTEARE